MRLPFHRADQEDDLLLPRLQDGQPQEGVRNEIGDSRRSRMVTTY